MRPQGMPGVNMGMGMPGMQTGGMPPGMSQPLQAGMNPAMAQVLLLKPQMTDSEHKCFQDGPWHSFSLPSCCQQVASCV